MVLDFFQTLGNFLRTNEDGLRFLDSLYLHFVSYPAAGPMSINCTYTPKPPSQMSQLIETSELCRFFFFLFFFLRAAHAYFLRDL